LLPASPRCLSWLSFASGESSLSVRRFSVREAVSAPFVASVWARSPSPSIDLRGIVGQAASLHVVSGVSFAALGARRWNGVCSHAEQQKAESSGLSTYYFQIVPPLWLLGQRRNYRIFQHASVPEIASLLLGEWAIPFTLHVDAGAYPRLEMRVQYGETDLAFLSRLLEEAGIAYRLPGRRRRRNNPRPRRRAPGRGASTAPLDLHRQPEPGRREGVRGQGQARARGPARRRRTPGLRPPAPRDSPSRRGHKGALPGRSLRATQLHPRRLPRRRRETRRHTHRRHERRRAPRPGGGAGARGAPPRRRAHREDRRRLRHERAGPLARESSSRSRATRTRRSTGRASSPPTS
jgi:hypothetical protein